MAKKGLVEVIHLECTSCRQNGQKGVSRHAKTKNKKTMPERIEMNKYCRSERKHTPHKEVK